MEEPIIKIEVLRSPRDTKRLFGQVTDSQGVWWTRDCDCWAEVLDDAIARLERRGR